MLFGRDGTRGLRLAPRTAKGGKIALEAVTLGEGGITEGDILVHDETDRALAGLLAAPQPPQMPVALGVLYGAPAFAPAPAPGPRVRDDVAGAGGDAPVGPAARAHHRH